MKATIRIVTPAAATAAAALLLTACADKPVRVPGGTFVEEPYQGTNVTVTSSQPQQTTPSTGTETVETEGLYIEEEVPVGPVGNEDQQTVVSGPQDTGTQLQPVEDDQQAVAKSNVPEGSVEYKVVKGDTLWGIGMVYGVPVARLAEINGLDEKAPLRIGQTLMIPPDAKNAVGKPIPQKKTEPAKTDAKTDAKAITTKTSTATKTTPATKDGETLYVVKKGDSLSVIAQRHHVKLADLVAANKVDPKGILRIGQTLVIPAAGSKAASTSTATKTDTKAATTTKTDAKTDTKTAATTTKTDTKAATTTTKTSSGASNAGEGSGGIVEPLGGGSFGGASSTPATTTPATTRPASSASSTLPAVSGVDANVLPITTEFESTIEDLADYHDRKLEDMLRLNPQFKTGQKIPAGTIVNLPFM